MFIPTPLPASRRGGVASLSTSGENSRWRKCIGGEKFGGESVSVAKILGISDFIVRYFYTKPKNDPVFITRKVSMIYHVMLAKNRKPPNEWLTFLEFLELGGD